MEHSWLGNEFVAAFESLLAQEAPRRVVWAGDYADPELDAEGRPLRLQSDSDPTCWYDGNLYMMTTDATLYRPPLPGLGVKMQCQRGPDGRAKRDKNGDTIWKREVDPEVVPTVESAIRVTQTSHPFILNWDKREYVNKRKVTRATYYWTEKRAEKRAIHPLPLLTVEGNGRGGGDFHCDQKDFEPGGYLSDRRGPLGDFKLIGRWARDHISVNRGRPAYDGWTEIKFDLVEMGSV
jgi:hypothetical protein